MLRIYLPLSRIYVLLSWIYLPSSQIYLPSFLGLGSFWLGGFIRELLDGGLFLGSLCPHTPKYIYLSKYIYYYITWKAYYELITSFEYFIVLSYKLDQHTTYSGVFWFFIYCNTYKFCIIKLLVIVKFKWDFF